VGNVLREFSHENGAAILLQIPDMLLHRTS
jgi:hypothetical protein